MPIDSKRKNLFRVAMLVTGFILALPSSWVSAKMVSNNTPGDATISTLANAAGMKSEGFSLAAVVISWMVISLLYVGVTYVRGMSALPKIFTRNWLQYSLPVLCLIGLGVAGYLSYVEIFVVEAVCGPVGDCNAVQSSPYARLFGVLPIGVLGIGGYLAILGAWFYPRLRSDRLARLAPVAILCMAIFGVIFSVYLTYLEIYVIRAVCMWCITSAVIMTLLLLVSLGPALRIMDEDSE